MQHRLCGTVSDLVFSHKQKLHKVDLRALRSITRALKSCSPHVLCTLTNITPVGFQILNPVYSHFTALLQAPTLILTSLNPNIKHVMSQIESLKLFFTFETYILGYSNTKRKVLSELTYLGP